MSPEPIASVKDVYKTYQMGEITVEALRGVTIDFNPGDYVSIMGPSGCGKSTLMNLLGCLDRPTQGQYFLGADDVSQMNDDDLSQIRGARLGFIFQSYNLIQQLSVAENIELPLYYQGCSETESRKIAIELAERVGLGDRIHHNPSSSPAVNNSASPLPAPSPTTPLSSSPTNPLETSTPNREPKFSISSTSYTSKAKP